MSILSKFRSLPSGRARRCAAVTCGVLACLSVCGGATAQFGPSIEIPPGLPTVIPAPPAFPPTVAPTGAGPYFTLPAWSQSLAPNVRFVILSNFNHQAVLDRETGLVWSRQSAGITTAGFAEGLCRGLILGNRWGWRIPEVDELQTLLDPTVPQLSSQPRLPVGHPFAWSPAPDNVRYVYWVGSLVESGSGTARRTIDLASGEFFQRVSTQDTLFELGVLCVRGR